MCRAVGTDQSGAINGEYDRQVLQHYIVYELIVRALQKSRVNGDDRLHALARQSRRESHAVLFGDADVEIALRELLRVAHHA